MQTKYRFLLITDRELRAVISPMTQRFDNLWAGKQDHLSHNVRHVQPGTHGPLQDIILLAI
jgi:hypothetical protein